MNKGGGGGGGSNPVPFSTGSETLCGVEGTHSLGPAEWLCW